MAGGVDVQEAPELVWMVIVKIFFGVDPERIFSGFFFTSSMSWKIYKVNLYIKFNASCVKYTKFKGIFSHKQCNLIEKSVVNCGVKIVYILKTAISASIDNFTLCLC